MHVGALRTGLIQRVMFVPFFFFLNIIQLQFFHSLFSEMVDAARKALISRVEELTNERSALKLELTSCQETINRLGGKTKEMEEEAKR